MTVKDEFTAALNVVLQDKHMGFEESLELLVYLNKVSAEIAKQLAEHFNKGADGGKVPEQT